MFGSRCFARPRPVCGGLGAPVAPMAAGLQRPVIPLGGGCQVTQGPDEIVVEPVLLAAPNVFHHHREVQHIQPVITQDVHHYHSHHKYVVEEQKKADEVVKHAHGLCGPATTQPATTCCSSIAPICGE